MKMQFMEFHEKIVSKRISKVRKISRTQHLSHTINKTKCDEKKEKNC